MALFSVLQGKPGLKALKFGTRHKYVDLGRGNSGAFDFEETFAFAVWVNCQQPDLPYHRNILLNNVRAPSLRFDPLRVVTPPANLPGCNAIAGPVGCVHPVVFRQHRRRTAVGASHHQRSVIQPVRASLSCFIRT